jgi:cytochrome c553
MRSVLAPLLVLVIACGKNTEPPPPTSGSPMAQAESGPSGKRRGGGGGGGDVAINEQASQMFATVCATCHGMDGTGNGPAAETLKPKPRNYTDAAWQASVTDDELRKTILKGGMAVNKSPMMPGNPQLEQQPEVLDGLIKIIRGFKK